MDKSDSKIELNPFAPPASERAEKEIESTTRLIPFQGTFDKKTANKIFKSNGSTFFLYVMIGLSAMTAVLFYLNSLDPFGASDEFLKTMTVIVVFTTTLGWIILATTAATNETQAINRPFVNTGFEGSWNETWCQLRFENGSACFDALAVKSQINKFGIGYRVQLRKHAVAIPIAIPNVAFQLRNWREVVQRYHNWNFDSLSPHVMPQPDLPENAIPVSRLKNWQQYRFELAHDIGDRTLLVLLAGLIGALAVLGYVYWDFQSAVNRLPNWNSDGQFVWYSKTRGLRTPYLVAYAITIFCSTFVLPVAWLRWSVRGRAKFYGRRLKGEERSNPRKVKAVIAEEGIWLIEQNIWVKVDWSDNVFRQISPAGMRLNVGMEWPGFLARRAFRNENEYSAVKQIILANVLTAQEHKKKAKLERSIKENR